MKIGDRVKFGRVPGAVGCEGHLGTIVGMDSAAIYLRLYVSCDCGAGLHQGYTVDGMYVKTWCGAARWFTLMPDSGAEKELLRFCRKLMEEKT